jgi:hypothetical protein
MKRPLLYLAIFSLFFAVTWISLAYLTTPTGDKGHLNTANVTLFLILFFGLATMLTTLIVAIIKTFQPNRKLPPLVIKDSLNHGCIVGTWLTGLLMLQLLRSATWVNLALWVIILLATEWAITGSRKVKP